MTNISKALPYIVEYRGVSNVFEPIAAFINENVATDFAMSQWKLCPMFSYRVSVGDDKFNLIN